MKYNILYIENGKGFGGALVGLSYLLWNLDNKYNPTVFCSYETDFLKTGLRKTNIRNVKLKRIHYPKKLKMILTKLDSSSGKVVKKILLVLLFIIDFLCSILPNTIKLYVLARNLNIDLIHLNNSILGNKEGLLLAKLLGVPCISHHQCFERRSPLTIFFCKLADFHIANSTPVKESLIEMGIDESKVIIAYSGVDMKEYTKGKDVSHIRSEFKLNKNIATFGIVGMLVDWKGHPVFLKAAQKVMRAIPDCKAFIIGDTPNGDPFYRNELKTLASDLGINKNVVFTGYRRNVPDFLELLDVVVHASTSPEPFGRVIVEAMAIGKPVVATKMGGPTEIIQDGTTGILVEANDDDGMAAAITKLLNDKRYRKRMGEAARWRARQKFGVDKYVESVQAVYEKILLKG